MAKKPPLSIYQRKIDLIGSIPTQIFAQRLATYLTHDATTLTEPAPFFNPTHQSNPQFKGWKLPPRKWAEWVNRMAGKYSAVWIKSGIFDSIMASIYEIPCNYDLISAVSQFWNPRTNTFVFPYGEATISLEDVMILGGYSVLGDSVTSVDEVGSIDLGGEIEVMNRFRTELVRSKAKKASHFKWIQMFMNNPNKQEYEHVAFLSLWVSRFVLPSVDCDALGKHVIPIAVKLSKGVRLALAPAILAGIYHNLTRLKEQIVYSNLNGGGLGLLGPFQLVQIWAYERFPVVGPRTPNDIRPGEPRVARWHTLNCSHSLPLLRSHMINHENFIWRPYAVNLENWKQPFYHQDSEQILSDSTSLHDDLKSFVCFITPCELNGLGCKAKYHPHRVAMQFGFDQDIPGGLSSYKVATFCNFLVPSRLFQPGVTKRYADWWKNANQTGSEKDQDSALDARTNESMECGEAKQEDCDKNSDFKCVDLTVEEDEFDDILVSLKKICDDTKKKIHSLKESCSDPQSKKKKLGSELGNGTRNVIIID